MRVFRDRAQAGAMLASKLREYAERPDAIVLALPRGGVPVGYAVARALNLPLDVLIVRKLGMPNQPELAMGAIAAGGVVVLNPEIRRRLVADDELVADIVAEERRELERRERAYRGDRGTLEVAGKTVVVVDDGAATGATMRAAVQALRALQATEIIVALPTASMEACEALRAAADRVICLQTPPLFTSVGQWYRSFDQTSDQEVTALLAEADKERRQAMKSSL